MSTIRKTSVLAVALFMAISGQVNAQRSATTQIEEVVVTAQKREENMQDVPISMSAMDESAIEKPSRETYWTWRVCHKLRDRAHPGQWHRDQLFEESWWRMLKKVTTLRWRFILMGSTSNDYRPAA